MKPILRTRFVFTLLASTATLAIADPTIELCGWTDHTGQCQITTPELGPGSPFCTPYMIPNARNNANDESSLLAKSLIIDESLTCHLFASHDCTTSPDWPDTGADAETWLTGAIPEWEYDWTPSGFACKVWMNEVVDVLSLSSWLS